MNTLLSLEMPLRIGLVLHQLPVLPKLEKSFSISGLPSPPATTHRGSCSTSVSTHHAPAAFVRKKFNPIRELELKGGAILWTNYRAGNSSGTNNHDETLIQLLVSFGLKDAITSVGLANELECLNEFGLFRLQANICIIVNKFGVPVGVIDVKKDLNIDHPNVHGQILDYMLRLKSYHGLQKVFGVVTTYRCWRICWLPDCGDIAEAEQVPTSTSLGQPTKEEIEMDTEDIFNENISIVVASENQQIVHGTDVIPWDAALLPVILGSLVIKMKSSPVVPVKTLDEKRTYIVMDGREWYWAKIILPTDFKLKNEIKVTCAKNFIFLHDFLGGADGRVWLACTESGKICVIKFAQTPTDTKVEDTIDDRHDRLQLEALNWKKIYNIDVHLIQLGGDWALVMPYLKPVLNKDESLDSLKPELRDAVEQAIDVFATLRLCHDDLKWDHVGMISPSKGKPTVYFYDLKQIVNMDTHSATQKMRQCLKLK